MTEPESVPEVLEVAVRMERQGVSFYERLSREAETPSARDLFSFLAAQEEKHLGIFRYLLEQTADYEPRYSYPGEYESYLSGAAWRVLEGFRMADDAGSPGGHRIVLAARRLEEGSIAWYSRLLPQLAGADRGIIEQVIEEERSHLVKLLDLGKGVQL